MASVQVGFSHLAFLLVLCLTRVMTTGFPKIPGPKSLKDRIGVIGAGPSGLHMGLLLKQAGFTDVTIFEASQRIGGKSKTIMHRGTPHDMGTVYLAPDYGRVIDLVRKYTEEALIDLPPASILLDNETSTLDFEIYIVLKTIENGFATDAYTAGRKVGAAIYKYIQLHKSLFGESYEFEIMPEPSEDVMTAINGTFLDYLRRNQLEVLEPLFLASHVEQGYGYLDEVPALYGLLWNTPKLMSSMLGRLQGAGSTGLYLLSGGFQPLWESIVKAESLKVEFGKMAYSLRRLPFGDGLTVKFIDFTTNETHTRYFDFVIWTPEMKTSLSLWSDLKTEEYSLFSKMQPAYFTTTLADTTGMKLGKTPIVYFADNVLKKRDHSVSAIRDSYGALNEQHGASYQAGQLPTGNDNMTLRTTVTYQYGTSKPYQVRLSESRNQSFALSGATEQEEIATMTWRYFPRFPLLDISNKILWRILDIQGKYGMWYIGSSICFESVKSVVDYNTLLMCNYVVPTTSRNVSADLLATIRAAASKLWKN